MLPAQRLTTTLARAIAPGRGAFVDHLVDLTRREIAELDHDDDLRHLLSMSIEENVARLLAILGEGADPTAAPPHGAMEYARRLGATPAPLASLLRAYRIGQARFTAHCLEVAARQTEPVSAAEQIAVVNQISSYLDHVCEQVTLVYQAEHERWLRGQEGLRLQWVRRILETADLIDERRAEEELGYALGGPQLAVELWTASGGQDTALDAAAAGVAEAYRAQRGRLVVRRDDRTLWLWLHPAAEHDGLPAATIPPQVFAAAGSIGTGRAGFRDSRRQADQVHALMAGARHRPTRATWADVAPVAALVRDRSAARAFITETLGDLAAPEERLAELRTTLRVFLEQHRSHAATAALLHVHRNTVGYRVEQALERCPLDPAVHTFALLTALHADRWCPP